jgi:4-amino-4-deoxy-L-arabinose transferase-like glycosyltransferase
VKLRFIREDGPANEVNFATSHGMLTLFWVLVLVSTAIAIAGIWQGDPRWWATFGVSGGLAIIVLIRCGVLSDQGK